MHVSEISEMKFIINTYKNADNRKLLTHLFMVNGYGKIYHRIGISYPKSDTAPPTFESEKSSSHKYNDLRQVHNFVANIYTSINVSKLYKGSDIVIKVIYK